jgi:FkbM family methyltransferase
VRTIIKSLLRRTPYRISGSGALNRFDAIEECLVALKRRGFSPEVIVDGGANIGHFARMARRIFADATIHLVEPQPACQEALKRLADTKGFVLHAAALVSPDFGGESASLATTPGVVSTGSFMSSGLDQAQTLQSVIVPAVTLDQLLERCPANGAPVFIKLDLQGYELQALAGSERTLAKTEVILAEVSFFAQAYEPPILELMTWLERKGFVLYDIAALSARARDGRARQGDFIFVRRTSALAVDTAWC